jgi:hypothetical protein
MQSFSLYRPDFKRIESGAVFCAGKMEELKLKQAKTV